MRVSERLRQLPPYHFADAAARIAAKRASGVDVISLAMGDPDLPTPDPVIDRLCETARDPINQRYPEYLGMAEFRQAIARWFLGRFKMSLDPEHEVVPLIGSKEGLVHLSLALLDPGDLALVPDPAYPVYAAGSVLAGASNYSVPLIPERGFLPDLAAIPAKVARRAKLLWLNYPNNPTGAVAPADFLHEAVRFAQEYDVLLVHDMAYADVSYDGYRPISLLEIPGAKDVAVEFFSFSKAYNMAGFRLGMLVGNAEVVQALGQLKTNIDTGIFRPLQYAAIEALALPPEWIAERNLIYQRRRDVLVAACNRLGLQVETPRASLYLWPRIPPGQTSKEFAFALLDRIGVFVTPGTNFGPGGEGYLRLSLTVPDDRLEEAIARLATLQEAAEVTPNSVT
ncbi:MAG TPA: LL-diaminopimelate aminotransferase [Ktedonobacterales bacterium]